jgi:coproporphyrinogen III oxidase-like Fe-S oxidoreductase
VGLGVGAHSFFPNGRRTANTSSVDDYLHLPEPQIQVDPPDHPLATWDFLWSMLRHVDGIDLARFQALTGKGIVPPAHLLSSGLLRRSPSHLALGSEGFAIADAIARLLYRDAMTVVDTSLTALPPPC